MLNADLCVLLSIADAHDATRPSKKVKSSSKTLPRADPGNRQILARLPDGRLTAIACSHENSSSVRNCDRMLAGRSLLVTKPGAEAYQ